MLQKLPPRLLSLLVQYLRSVDNNLRDLLQFSQVNRRLRHHSQRLVWEYFTLSRAIKNHDRFETVFRSIQKYISRLQISNDPTQLTGQSEWVEGLERIAELDWSGVRMVSVELDGFVGMRRAARAVVGFAHARLTSVKELWVTLSEDREIVESMFAYRYEHVDELRIVGKALASMGGKVQEGRLVEIPGYSRLAAISLDGQAAGMAEATELVKRCYATLRELNIEEYTETLGKSLALHPSSPEWLEYPQLRQLAISSIASDYSAAMLDGRRMPAVEMLYFRETTYPSLSGGTNPVFESTGKRLMTGEWATLRLLVVDALSRGDIAVIGRRAPCLEVLRIGLLGSDVEIEVLDDGGPVLPAMALDLEAVL
ncbi:hypothetical protein IWW38_004141, partial [Coemansia aciculifera]